MSPEKQNIEIAKAIGYTDIRHEQGEDVDIDARAIYPWEGLRGEYYGERRFIPNFTKDLNCVHDAIMKTVVHGPDIIEFCSNEGLFNTQLDILCDYLQVPAWHLGAKEYCEVLLKTLGKWSDN